MQDLVVANEFINSSIFSLCIPSNASFMDSKVSIIATCISPQRQKQCIDPKHSIPSLEMKLHKELFPFAQNFSKLDTIYHCACTS